MAEPAFPSLPRENEPARAAWASADTLALLAQRRSTKIAQMVGPGPSREQTLDLLRLATRAPDHGKLAPWRFLVLEGDGRVRAGEALAAVRAEDGAGADAAEQARGLFLRAPTVVAVISRAAPHAKIPEWEQVLSVGAVCFQLLLVAHAAGFAGCWLTEWPVYDARARAALGLAEHERIAGFIYLGAAAEPPLERPRPALESLVAWF